MTEPDNESQQLWSFRTGMLGPDESIKGFDAEASDGHAGKIAWASYAPGESYLVVSVSHHLQHRHHVVPAGLVERISAAERQVQLRLTRGEIEQAPEHHDELAPLAPPAMDAVRSTWATFAIRG